MSLVCCILGCTEKTPDSTDAAHTRDESIVVDATPEGTINLDTLPRWAGVALAARCAELLIPSFDNLWADAPPANRDLVVNAIAVSKRAAEFSQPPPDLSEIANSVTESVGQFELHLNGMPPEITEIDASVKKLDEKSVKLIRDIVDVAARAARAADASDTRGANIEAQDGVSWAYAAAEGLDDDDLKTDIDEAVASIVSLCNKTDVTDAHRVYWSDNGWQIRE